MVSRWLSDAPANAPWRVQMMRRMVNALQKETIPLSIRTRIMAAFVNSNDSSLPQMFHQLLSSQSPVIRQLSALGCGAIQDIKSIRELSGLMSDPYPDVRFAAVMALVAIGSSQSIDPVLDMLIKGDEELSQVAAEAFATQPEIGFNILKESAAYDNLLVRRAAVFGLEKVDETWALDLLKHMQIEDGQWVVRNAANQALETLQKPDAAIPHPLLPPHNSPWLIEYASKQGVGIIPGNPASDLLLQALKTGTPEEKLAALDYLVERPADKELVKELSQIVFKEAGLMSEAAGYALWLLAMGGTALSVPVEMQAN
jgi:HEAT repeat protein